MFEYYSLTHRTIIHALQIFMNVRWHLHVTKMLTASTLLGPSFVPAMKGTAEMGSLVQVNT